MIEHSDVTFQDRYKKYFQDLQDRTESYKMLNYSLQQKAKNAFGENIFSNPDEIDALINSRLKQFPRKGGKTSSRNVSWSESELQIIDSVIWDYIAKQGLSREATAQQIYSRWDISLSTARKWITDSIKRIANTYSQEEQEEVRRVWLERCESILQECIETRDKQNALKALDLMAKSLGLYKETKDVNLDVDGGISFDFS